MGGWGCMDDLTRANTSGDAAVPAGATEGTGMAVCGVGGRGGGTG